MLRRKQAGLNELSEEELFADTFLLYELSSPVDQMIEWRESMPFLLRKTQSFPRVTESALPRFRMRRYTLTLPIIEEERLLELTENLKHGVRMWMSRLSVDDAST